VISNANSTCGDFIGVILVLEWSDAEIGRCIRTLGADRERSDPEALMGCIERFKAFAISVVEPSMTDCVKDY
jgi:hypothetical protein